MIDKLALKGDRVLVKQLPHSEKIGSFFVPETVAFRKTKRRGDAWRAEVVTIGDTVCFEKHQYEFKKGDIVYCAPVSLDCPKMNIGGNDYYVVLQEDLLSVEEK